MPGPVSDSYDPEWGTGSNASDIAEAIQRVYNKLSEILNNEPPVYILDLVHDSVPSIHKRRIEAGLTEWEWQILRFACERAKDSI